MELTIRLMVLKGKADGEKPCVRCLQSDFLSLRMMGVIKLYARVRLILQRIWVAVLAKFLHVAAEKRAIVLDFYWQFN